MLLRALLSALALAMAGCAGSIEPAGNAAPTPVPVAPVEPPVVAPVTYSPFVSAHRGGAAYAPENTMAAYRNAVRLGVDDLEADTVPTRDGVLVLIHDDSLDRTTNCSGKVNSFSYEELQACDAGYWWSPGQSTTSPDEVREHPLRGKGVKIPQAQELFDYAVSLGPTGPTVTIEIKNTPNEAHFELRCETTATQLVRMIQQSGIQGRIIVQSFDPTCVDNVKLKDPSIRTLYLAFAGAYANAAYCAAMGHEFSSPSFNTPDFNAGYVALAHAAGVKVNPYTVDREADIRRMIDLGVDGLISNYPACLMRLQGRPLPESMFPTEAELDELELDLCRE